MTDIRTETVPLVDGSALRLTVAEPIGPVRGSGAGVQEGARGSGSDMAGPGVPEG